MTRDRISLILNFSNLVIAVHMRRAQSVRHYSRPSTAQGVDDLGLLREDEDSVEDVLRKQLIDKERECDKVRVFHEIPPFKIRLIRSF